MNIAIERKRKKYVDLHFFRETEKREIARKKRFRETILLETLFISNVKQNRVFDNGGKLFFRFFMINIYMTGPDIIYIFKKNKHKFCTEYFYFVIFIKKTYCSVAGNQYNK